MTLVSLSRTLSVAGAVALSPPRGDGAMRMRFWRENTRNSKPFAPFGQVKTAPGHATKSVRRRAFHTKARSHGPITTLSAYVGRDDVGSARQAAAPRSGRLLSIVHAEQLVGTPGRCEREKQPGTNLWLDISLDCRPKCRTKSYINVLQHLQKCVKFWFEVVGSCLVWVQLHALPQ